MFLEWTFSVFASVVLLWLARGGTVSNLVHAVRGDGSCSKHVNADPVKSLTANKKPMPTTTTTADDKKTELRRRQAIQKRNEDETQGRVDEKIAEVRARSEKQANESNAKDGLRVVVQPVLEKWTDRGTHRGNIRELLSRFHQVIYEGTSWNPLSTVQLKEQATIKIHYYKAVLLVHPDKIQQKGLKLKDVVLAEMILDELQNAWEVFQCEINFKLPPPGSVGPKGGTDWWRDVPTSNTGAGMTHGCGMKHMGRTCSAASMGGMRSSMGCMGRPGRYDTGFMGPMHLNTHRK
ncbi:hypothetical protein NDN08_008208 [Rhodosorus marinus]|uniref:J domain-containing protein n=1 Tax=Rhodosorus marinus TaxID=101924 RepID=A0AAV8V2K4_9RHOD|nr:hypothetical protein NDN08_008208 [Rhodosorus marinus]